MYTVKHIRKGDTIKVTAGKDKGKTGKILKVDHETGRVIAEKINFIKKHQKPTQQVQKGGIIEREGFISASNCQLVCPKCKEATRTSHKLVDDKSVRSCKKCGEIVDKV